MVKLSEFEFGKILSLREQGFTIRRIQQMTSIPRSTINRSLLKYNENGTIERKKGSGRPYALNNDHINAVTEIHKENPIISAPRLNILFEEKENKKVSDQTIRRCLNSQNLYAYSPIRKPLMSSKNIAKRKELCDKWIFMPDSYWENIIFSDECKFNLYNSDGRIYVWREPKDGLDPRYVETTVKFGRGGLNVWGCFSACGVGNLVFIQGNMCRYQYLRILVNNLKQSAAKMGLVDYVFQQDNDPKHTSKVIRKYLGEESIETLVWPSQSPDLNPIEHVWSFMKKQLNGRSFANIKELEAELKSIWSNLPVDFINNLIKSMPKRVVDVVKANGRYTKY